MTERKITMISHILVKETNLSPKDVEGPGGPSDGFSLHLKAVANVIIVVSASPPYVKLISCIYLEKEDIPAR